MSVDEGTKNTARSVHARTARDLKEALTLGVEAGPLVRMLRARLDVCEKSLAAMDHGEADWLKVEHVRREAEAVCRLAAAAHHAGSLERATVLTLRDDHEHARHVLAIRTREAEAARKLAESPLQAILKLAHDPGRQRSERATNAVVYAALHGYGNALEKQIAAGLEPGELAWHPLHEARALHDYKATLRQTSDGSARLVRFPIAAPLAKLQELFRERRRHYAYQWRMLEAEAGAGELQADVA